MERNMWGEVWGLDNIPRMPCPRCANGRLWYMEDSRRIEEPFYSKEFFKSEEWEPGMDDERFVLFLKCDDATCGEYVTVSGDTSVAEDCDGEGMPMLVSVLRPRCLFPAPSMIALGPLPEPVARELRRAFALFWTDLDSAANRLRVSVERLLDHLGVPTASINGGRLSLYERISAFSATNLEHSDSLTAMRHIGNLGSHGTGVVREAFLDALEVFEECLEDLVGQRRQRLAAIKARLIASKGEY